MSDIFIDYGVNDSKIIRSYERQLALTQQLITNQNKLHNSTTAGFSRQETAINRVQAQTEKTNTAFGGLFSSMRGVAVGISFAALIKQLTDITVGTVTIAARIEQLQAAFTVAYGSTNIAADRLKFYQDIASKTPFQFEELATSMLKLKNRGFEPTRKEIISLGDVSASSAKSFDQYVEAVLDAQTFQFERLREFGITAQKNGDKVSLTYRNQTTTVNATADAIRDLLISYGQLEGISGSMDLQAKTLNGTLSSMKDELDKLAISFGNSLLPEIKPVIENFTEFLSKLDPDQIMVFYAPIRDVLLPALRELVGVLYNLYEELTQLKTADDYTKQLNTGFRDLVNLTTLAVRGITNIIKFVGFLAKASGLDIFIKSFRDGAQTISELIDKITEFTGGNSYDKALDAAQKTLDAEKSQEKVDKGRSARDGAQSKIAARKKKEAEDAAKAAKAAEEAAAKEAEAAKARAAAAKKYEADLNRLRKAVAAYRKEVADSLTQTQIDNELNPFTKENLTYERDLAAINLRAAAMKEELKAAGVKGAVYKELSGVIDQQTKLLKEQLDTQHAVNLALIDTEIAEAKISAEKLKQKTFSQALYGAEAENYRRLGELKAKQNEIDEIELEGKLDNEIFLIKQNGKKQLETQNEIDIKIKQAEIRAYSEKIQRYIAQQQELVELAKQSYIAQKLAENPNYNQDTDLNLANFNYVPSGDANLQGMRNTLQGMVNGLTEAVSSADYTSLYDRFWKKIGNVLGVKDPGVLNELKSAFEGLFKQIVEGWTSTTAAQIEANAALVQNIQNRRQTVQEELNFELEAYKAGYASNVEAKKAELAAINDQERQAIQEGLRLKKRQATQELILSEAQAGASLIETIAKTFGANASLPFGAGIILSGVIIAGMLAQFAGYKSKIKALNSSVQFFTGGIPAERMLSGEVAKSDLPGSGSRGHRIGNTNMWMSAFEMIVNEKSTKKNKPFLKYLNSGAFDNVDLMKMIQLPSMFLASRDTDESVKMKEYAQLKIAGNQMSSMFDKQTKELKNHYNKRPQWVSHKNQLIKIVGDEKTKVAE